MTKVVKQIYDGVTFLVGLNRVMSFFVFCYVLFVFFPMFKKAGEVFVLFEQSLRKGFT